MLFSISPLFFLSLHSHWFVRNLTKTGGGERRAVGRAWAQFGISRPLLIYLVEYFIYNQLAVVFVRKVNSFSPHHSRCNATFLSKFFFFFIRTFVPVLFCYTLEYTQITWNEWWWRWCGRWNEKLLSINLSLSLSRALVVVVLGGMKL